MSIATRKRWRFKQPSVIPGFGMALGVTLAWLILIVLIPISGLIIKDSELDRGQT